MEQWQNIASSRHQGTTYCIVGNFRKLVESNFHGKTFTKPQTLQVFSLESFPLYGIYWHDM